VTGGFIDRCILGLKKGGALDKNHRMRSGKIRLRCQATAEHIHPQLQSKNHLPPTSASCGLRQPSWVDTPSAGALPILVS